MTLRFGMRMGLVSASAALAGAAVYEIVLAAGAVSIGTQPGDSAPGEPFALVVALAAMAVGAGLAIMANSRPAPPLAFLAPAAVFFALARYYTFDPYYAPTLRRMSDGGLVGPVWMYALVAAAVAAAILCRTRSGVGAAATAAVVVLCGLTTLLEPGGH